MIKTAGTTLNYIFRNNFGHNVLAANDDFTLKKLKKLLFINKNLKVISGHSIRTMDDYESVISNVQYITFLRNPVDRYISHYNHGNKVGQKKIRLEDRLKLIGEKDYQTKFILGAKNIKERSYEAGKSELEEAKKILSNDYSIVGLVEKFDESLVLMKNLINNGELNIKYQRKNVNRKKVLEVVSIEDTIKDKIIEANKIDNELFNYVKNILFKKQIEKYGDHFKQDVYAFKKSNKNYKFKKVNLLKYRLAYYLMYKFIL
jgi:hypothetical protein